MRFSGTHRRQGDEIRIHPPPRIFFEAQIHPHFRRQISTTTDRLHVRSIRDDGSIARWFRFRRADLPILELALERSESDEAAPVARVGSITLPCGGRFDVGARSGWVHMRLVTDGAATTYHFRMTGPELVALRYAIEDLKSRPEAAISEKETSHDQS